MGGVVLHQLLQHPGGCGGGDPLSCVDSTVDPDCWLASTFAPVSQRMRTAWKLVNNQNMF